MTYYVAAALAIVQVVGLVIGLLGVFYLVEGVMGPRGNVLLRCLLVAIGSTVLSIAMFSGEVALESRTMTGRGTVQNPIAFAVVVGFALGLALPSGYNLIWQRLRQGDISSRLIYSGSIITFLIGAPYDIVTTNRPMSIEFLTIGYGVSILLVGPTYELLSRYGRRKTWAVGLVFALLGTVSQLAIPVLDLLNIKVV